MHFLSVLLSAVISLCLMSATFPEKSVTMYASDGRTLSVLESEVGLYGSLGWYEHIYDVVVSMYDKNGVLESVFVDDAPQKLTEGYTYAKSETTQLMFADDGRIIYVPHAQVSAYLAVNWYRGGGRVDNARPMIALTFDDGPAKYTETILACLEKYEARATFFVQGKSVPRYSDAIKHAARIGCEIGNHTWDHAKLTSVSSDEVKAEISKTNNAVYEITGVYPTLFRPPYGSYNGAVLTAANMPAVMWSLDTLDWKTRNTEKTVLSIKNSAKDGSIVLMHDIHAPTAPAAEQIIPYLLKQGYQLVTVSELLDARKGGAQIGKAYGNGY